MKFLIVLCSLVIASLGVQSQTNKIVDIDTGLMVASINDYLDKVFVELEPLLTESGLDPMTLPDMIEEFQEKPLLITYHGELSLKNGKMFNINKISRYGNAFMSYDQESLRIQISAALKSLNVDYNYVVHLMDIGPDGRMDVYVENIIFAADFYIDAHTFQIHIANFEVEKIGYLDIKFRGNLVFDWLVNTLTKLVTTMLKGVLTNFVSSKVEEFLLEAVEEINANSVAGNSQYQLAMREIIAAQKMTFINN